MRDEPAVRQTADQAVLLLRRLASMQPDALNAPTRRWRRTWRVLP